MRGPGFGRLRMSARHRVFAAFFLYAFDIGGIFARLADIQRVAMVLEGAAADWPAIYMRKLFEAPPFVAVSAVTGGALMQSTVRFFVDSFVERWGPVRVARVR